MNASTLRQCGSLFGFDRREVEILTRSLEDVLRDAANGAAEDERETLPPPSEPR